MADLITLEGKAQEKGKKVTGYKFPNNLDELKFPFKLLFHPNYKIGIKEKIQTDKSLSYKNVNMKPTDAIFVEKNGNELITKEGYVLSSFDKNKIVISPEKINSDTIPNVPTSVTKELIPTSKSNSTLEQDLNNSPLGKTARKVQIGFSVVGWGIFGLLAYKFWNKSTTWKVMLSVFGAYNLYSTYKVFSKPAIKVGGNSDSNINTGKEITGQTTETTIGTNTETGNITRSQKIINLVTSMRNDPLEKDMDNFHRNFFNKLSDSELNTWVILSKALKDSSVQKEMEKGKESGYKYLKSKYGLLETDVDNAMNKYGESLSQSFASDNNSNFSNFESDLDLDI